MHIKGWRLMEGSVYTRGWGMMIWWVIVGLHNFSRQVRLNDSFFKGFLYGTSTLVWNQLNKINTGIRYSLFFFLNHVDLCLIQTPNQVTSRHRKEKERQFTALLLRHHIGSMNRWPTQLLTERLFPGLCSWYIREEKWKKKKNQRKEETLDLRVTHLS